jgi:transcriptional regulator with XRE-family HTH domain
MEFKDKVKEFRLKSNLTQLELAEKLQVTRTRITDTESGRVKGNLKFITNISRLSQQPMTYWIDETFEKDYKTYEALDVLIDDLIESGLIKDDGKINDNIALLIRTVLEKEIKVKFKIRKEMGK